jgi:hypothetical protein
LGIRGEVEAFGYNRPQDAPTDLVPGNAFGIAMSEYYKHLGTLSLSVTHLPGIDAILRPFGF